MLTAADWARLDWAARRIAVEAALPFAGDASAAVGGVLALLRRAEAGDAPSDSEFAAARASARAAEAATADRMTAAVLDAIEAAIVERESCA